jgi:hypothetical protein
MAQSQDGAESEREVPPPESPGQQSGSRIASSLTYPWTEGDSRRGESDESEGTSSHAVGEGEATGLVTGQGHGTILPPNGGPLSPGC